MNTDPHILSRILRSVGEFSDQDLLFFEAYTHRQRIAKAHSLLHTGQVAGSIYFLLAGAVFQTTEDDDRVIDLHLPQEWIIARQSLSTQSPATASIKAFYDSEYLEIRLSALHALIARSRAFLQFNRILIQEPERLFYYDNALSPDEKYACILRSRPALLETFPLHIIASYLKLAPETLSRVRSRIIS